jgi:hypothetical protein
VRRHALCDSVSRTTRYTGKQRSILAGNVAERFGTPIACKSVVVQKEKKLAHLSLSFE